MRFERSFRLPLAPDALWPALWDIARMVKCVPGCTGATMVEDGRRYQATIVERVGPFKLEVPLDIEVRTADPLRALQLRAVGKDSRIGTEITWDLTVELEPHGAETEFRMTVDALVVGRLVSLGQGVIKLKGDQTIGRFADALRASLAGSISA